MQTRLDRSQPFSISYLSHKLARLNKTQYKYCQRHNGPEGWVLLTKVTSSYTNLDQIPKFKISTVHQHFDLTLTSKSWPNIHLITSPSLSSKILINFQFQNFVWASTSNSWPNLVLKVWTKFTFITKPQLLNLQQTVANMILIINIDNSNNINVLWIGIFTLKGHITQVYKQELVTESVR